MNLGSIDFARFIEMLVAVAAIFIPLWAANRKQNREQHKQNLSRFDYLINEAAERPHHAHLDGRPGMKGTLQAENIVYSPRKFEGD
jgi:hypothetical protein